MSRKLKNIWHVYKQEHMKVGGGLCVLLIQNIHTAHQLYTVYSLMHVLKDVHQKRNEKLWDRKGITILARIQNLGFQIKSISFQVS